MNEIRTDIPRRQKTENWDEYTERVYRSLAEGEIANGWRRKGTALEQVGEHLEHLAAFEG